MTESPAIEKRVATLQAQAALRGIAVEPLSASLGGGFIVGQNVNERHVPDLDALVALLARMGVSE